MIFYLHNDLEKYFSTSSHFFEQIMSLRGICYRNQNGRLTQRVHFGNKSYFIKQHFGVGFKEIIKNLLQLRWPVTSAKNEWLAIKKLQTLGIAVPFIVGFGKRGSNPARLQSFILMEELTSMVSLEDFCKNWQESPPDFALKQKLIAKIAHIGRVLHQNGINHRDFYICHFLLDAKRPDTQLYLIDLHRAQLRRYTPQRWIIKDLAGLYFSSKDIGLTQRDRYRFMQAYTGMSLREILRSEQNFWQKVKMRGEGLYLKHFQ